LESILIVETRRLAPTATRTAGLNYQSINKLSWIANEHAAESGAVDANAFNRRKACLGAVTGKAQSSDGGTGSNLSVSESATTLVFRSRDVVFQT
jgi:hypothetical protein